MALGNNILLNDITAKGVYKEGIISGTPKPGTVMQIKAATEFINGRPTWEVYNADADGDRRMIAVLLPDRLQGKLATDAYTNGSHGFLYIPQAGEELNMLVLAAGTGTGDALAIGDMLMVDDSTGILIAESSPQAEPFQCMETIADLVAAGSLVHCVYTGY